MTRLNTIGEINVKKKKRVGRGIGSGKGKTSGRGHKGQKSRSGVAIKSFEGGQMPLYRRLPKRGFNSIKKIRVGKINLGKIQLFIEQKKINKSEKISLDLLKKLKIINKNSIKLKILGFGEVKEKINIEADLFSKSAKMKLEKIGGTFQLSKSKN
jgi:large subunit ribosomal protein L15